MSAKPRIYPPYDPIARHARYLKHQPSELAGNAVYRATHEASIRLQRAGYRALNGPQIALKKQADQLLHPEKQQARRRRHYALKGEEELRNNADYRRTHPDVMEACAARRRARKKQAAVNDFTVVQWRWMKALYRHQCVYCGKLQQSMTKDHLIPLHLGGNHTVSNIVPACRSCNSKKGIGPPLPFVLALQHYIELPGDDAFLLQQPLF
jgi:5-methylcytosine-specific restriction endonuclease McrA